jgi:hypothetical protein
MRGRSHVLGLLSALVLGVAGCQDTVTMPRVATDQPTAQGVKALAGSPYGCYVSIASPSGRRSIRSHWSPLELAPNLHSPDGQTTRFEVRVYRTDKSVDRYATCTVPKTSGALELASRRFSIPGSQVVPKLIEDPIGTVTTQDCNPSPDNTYYICDGLVVDGGRRSFCQRYPFDPACTGGYGPGWESPTEPCDGDLSACGGGGGPQPENPPECPATDPACLVPLQPGDTTLINDALKLVKAQLSTPELTSLCNNLKQKFLTMLAAGAVYRGAWNSPDHSGQIYQGKIHLDPKYLDWARQLGGGYVNLVAELALHEAAHALGYPNHTGETHSPYETFPYRHVSGPDSSHEQCVP